MSLYDILACPTCKISVIKHTDFLLCEQCNTHFPIINDVPIMFPDGSNPLIEHEDDLHTQLNYNPWVHRVILQSLLDDQIVLDMGAGDMSLDDPCIIRMDVKLSPHVDIVGDAHALPFLPESIDYIFSLAVFEHLRNPFQASQEIYSTLKDGGFIYHECNFVFAYHGYPHHYFNASLQGMEQVFAQFTPLRKGVAPYQMPSFALDMVLRTYLRETKGNNYEHGRQLTVQLERVLNQNLMAHDIYFSEEGALQVAAGTYFSGLKQETATSTLIPTILQDIWHKDELLQIRFPDINKLSSVDNLLMWAKKEGQVEYPKIKTYLDNLTPFNKRGSDSPWFRNGLDPMMETDPEFGAIGINPNEPLDIQVQIVENQKQPVQKKKKLENGARHLKYVYDTEGFRATIREGLIIFANLIG